MFLASCTTPGPSDGLHMWRPPRFANRLCMCGKNGSRSCSNSQISQALRRLEAKREQVGGAFSQSLSDPRIKRRPPSLAANPVS